LIASATVEGAQAAAFANRGHGTGSNGHWNLPGGLLLRLTEEQYSIKYTIIDSKIAAAIGMKEEDAKKQLRLIVSRRNQIVHEAYIELTTGGKRAISKDDCESSVSFMGNLGETIVKLVAI
jgi:hypothetical protein